MYILDLRQGSGLARYFLDHAISLASAEFQPSKINLDQVEINSKNIMFNRS
jgi:hypothetical protein